MELTQIFTAIVIITMTYLIMNYKKLFTKKDMDLPKQKILTNCIDKNDLDSFIQNFQKLKIDPNIELIVSYNIFKI